MSKALEEAKRIIKENITDARCGIFDTHNIAEDETNILYENVDLDLRIDICYNWEYFEVFGLTDEEFLELKVYYEEIKEPQETETEIYSYINDIGYPKFISFTKTNDDMYNFSIWSMLTGDLTGYGTMDLKQKTEFINRYKTTIQKEIINEDI